MKKLFILFAFFIIQQHVAAQQDTAALYQRFPGVPPISLMKSDSGLITKNELKKNRPVILMYFSPECHHCQRQMEEMLSRIEDLKKVEIILATYRSLDELKNV